MAIQVILEQNFAPEYEILIVGPDEETEKIANNFQQQYPQVKYLQDRGAGKPAALNLALGQVKGEILVLTDGDVWVEQNALKYLLEPFVDSKVGAVSGHPVSINSRNNLFGYWSHFLTEAAHHLRLTEKDWPCSGYLYAIRNLYIRNKFVFRSQDILPENVFSEDAVITQMIHGKGYQVIYARKPRFMSNTQIILRTGFYKKKERWVDTYKKLKIKI